MATERSHVHHASGQQKTNYQANSSNPVAFSSHGYAGTNKRIQIPNGRVLYILAYDILADIGGYRLFTAS